MSRWTAVFGTLILGFLAVSQARASEPVPVKPAVPAKRDPSPIAALRAVPKEWPEIPADPKTTLTDVFRAISERLRNECQIDVEFTIEFRAFEAEGLNAEKMLDFSPVADRPLRREANLSLAGYLRLILDRLTEKGPILTGATFILRKKSIEITTNQAVRVQVWGGHPGPFLPLVHAAFEKKPLDEVLKDFAEQAEHNIVVDSRAAAKAKTLVTAQLTNTPLDTAVTLLADMAELRPVYQDNVIYVTTRENALLLGRGMLRTFQLAPSIYPPQTAAPAWLILRVD